MEHVTNEPYDMIFHIENKFDRVFDWNFIKKN